MLYMVVNTHSAESCAFRGEEESRELEGAFSRFEELAPGLGVTVKGSWINRPSHEAFILVDAPDAHAVDAAVVDSGLVGRTHTRVLSVIAVADVVTPYADAAIAPGGTDD